MPERLQWLLYKTPFEKALILEEWEGSKDLCSIYESVLCIPCVLDPVRRDHMLLLMMLVMRVPYHLVFMEVHSEVVFLASILYSTCLRTNMADHVGAVMMWMYDVIRYSGKYVRFACLMIYLCRPRHTCISSPLRKSQSPWILLYLFIFSLFEIVKLCNWTWSLFPECCLHCNTQHVCR